ncbi:MAG: amidase [Acidobacteria bacterium]|nr:amidase [Acidobacteriota bacterium]
MTDLTIQEAAGRLAAGDIRSVDLTRQCLERIAARDKELNAFIAVRGDRALADAEDADREMAAGRYRGSLHGIPVSLKDLIDVEGMPTTAASRVRAHHVASEDSPIAAALKRAGAVIIGKCNLHEFAFGTTSEDSAYGPVRNPYDASRSPGGSSGGSGAAVAAGMCLGSVGTDTGGSIRIPAAACGIVGLKPGKGELSCAGVVPLSWTLDNVGPMTRSVTDAWLMYRVMRNSSGATREPSARRVPERRESSDTLEPRTVRGLRLAVLGGYFAELLENGVRDRFEQATETLRAAGAELTHIQLPHAHLVPASYVHLVLGEAAAYHASTLDTAFDRYTRAVALRLSMGRYILAEDYVRAHRGSAALRAHVDEALTRCEALVLPTLPITPPRIGATTVDFGSRTEPLRNAMLRLTQPFNLTGHPAISLPCGGAVPPGDTKPLPVGFQIVGRRGGTIELLRVAKAIEEIL